MQSSTAQWTLSATTPNLNMQMHTPQRPTLLHGGMLGETSPGPLLNMSLTAVQSQHLTNNESSKLGFKDALDLMTSLCPNRERDEPITTYPAGC